MEKIPSISICPHPVWAQQESLVACSKQQPVGTELQSPAHGYRGPPWALKHSHIPPWLGQDSVWSAVQITLYVSTDWERKYLYWEREKKRKRLEGGIKMEGDMLNNTDQNTFLFSRVNSVCCLSCLSDIALLLPSSALVRKEWNIAAWSFSGLWCEKLACLICVCEILYTWILLCYSCWLLGKRLELRVR